MAKEVRLPQLDEAMEEGAILSCLVKAGQCVKKGDSIFEIETDKVTLELESPEDGFVKAITVKEGQTVHVGDLLLILGGKNEEINIDSVIGKNKKPGKTAAPADEAPAGFGDEKITQADLSTAADSQADYKLGQKVPLSRLARITAQRMIRSKHDIPCFYLNMTVDVTRLTEYQQDLNKTGKTKITIDDFLIRAISVGFEHWPVMTGRLEAESIVFADSVGIGITVAVKAGSLEPVIKDADKKNLVQIAECRSRLVERTIAGKLTPDDLEGGCITVCNLGPLGIDSVTPVVVPGQCSILGVGRIADGCVPGEDDIVTSGKLMKMTLAVDHRIVNGSEAAQFLGVVGTLLEEPEKLT